MQEKKERLFSRLKKRLSEDELFHETVVQANRLGAHILFYSGLLLLLILLLTLVGVFPLSRSTILLPVLQGTAEIALLLIVCRIVKNDAWWLKYVILFGMVTVYASLDSLLTHKAAILMVIPVIFSSRYFSKKITIHTALWTTALFAVSALWGATNGMINLNIVTMDAGRELVTPGGFLGQMVESAGLDPAMLRRNTLLFDFLPKCMMFSIAAIISVNIAKRGKELVLTQHEKDLNTARIEYDLQLAARIQADMMENIAPSFPEREEFDICASMTPAREVGGDFYDFFLIDDDHLAIVMADVSGKGVPAALFMMTAKTLVEKYAMSGRSPAKVLEAVNHQICANNRDEMFVTVWLGILELTTGKLTAANAGHEYPLLKTPTGKFEYVKDRHGFVIGGMDGVQYHDYELQMDPDSKLFLYTDGLTEAKDAAGAQFGSDRLLAALLRTEDDEPKQILQYVDTAITRFAIDAPQFDDYTMLCLRYIGGSTPAQNGKELTVDATVENIPAVTEFINAELDTHDCPLKAQMQIDVAIDELVANIASYAYAPEIGPVTVHVSFEEEPKAVVISFIDRGRPFNPLVSEDPDITLPADEREIGGLGVFLVKKTMDEVSYDHQTGQNIMKIKKYFI